MKFNTRHAICPICHNNMNHTHLGIGLKGGISRNDLNIENDLYFFKVWLCPNCAYWVPTNPSGDAPLQFRSVHLKTSIQNQQDISIKVYKIMADKFFDAIDEEMEKHGCENGCEIGPHYFCKHCGTWFPNEEGLTRMEILPSWCKRKN